MRTITHRVFGGDRRSLHRNKKKIREEAEVASEQMLSKIVNADGVESKKEVVRSYNPFFYVFFEEKECLQNDTEQC